MKMRQKMKTHGNPRKRGKKPNDVNFATNDNAFSTQENIDNSECLSKVKLVCEGDKELVEIYYTFCQDQNGRR